MAGKEAMRRGPYDSLAEGVIESGHLKPNYHFNGRPTLGFGIKHYRGTPEHVYGMFDEGVPETAKARFFITAIQKRKPFLQYTIDQKLIVKKPNVLLRVVSTILGYPYAKIKVKKEHRRIIEEATGKRIGEVNARNISDRTAIKILDKILERKGAVARTPERPKLVA